MPRWIKKTGYWVVGLTVVFFALAWTVLASPLFSDTRRSVVQDLLSAAIGQPLLIDTDVRVFVAPTARLTVSDALLPSEGISDLNLAELKLLELDLGLFDLVRGRLNLNNLKVDGLRVNLVRQDDDTTSWSAPPETTTQNQAPKSAGIDHDSGIIAFLRDKNAEISSVVVNVEDLTNGFEFLFVLEALSLQQLDNAGGASVSSQGTVNEQPFQIMGDYPRGELTKTSVSVGGITMDFDAQAIAENEGGGFSGELTLDTGEIGDILDLLKLNRTIEGSGQLSAGVVRQGTALSFEDLQTVVNLQNGSELTLNGTAADILASLDFDITVAGRMFPEGQPPDRARELEDLMLTNFSANLVSTAGDIEVQEVLLETNYFEGGFREIGPITVDRLRRTESGSLALENVFAQIGPREAPYVTATGGIQNLLQFQEIDFTGALSAPASLVLSEFRSDTAQAFGGIAAEFEVSDASGLLSLTRLEARSEDTDLWTMSSSAQVRTTEGVSGVDLQLDAEVPDTAAFLSALQLTAVDAGALEFALTAKGKTRGLETQTSISVGQSRLNTELDTVVDEDQRTTIRGSIRSDQLSMDDLGNVVETGLQIASLSSSSDDAAGSGDRDVQPLVIELKDEGAEPDAVEATDDGRPVQPLVVEGGDLALTSDEPVTDASGRVIQPLVLDDIPDDAKAVDLFDIEQIGRDLDLEIGIDVKKIIGPAGISKIASALTAKDGKADLGPIELQYGGGYFRLGAGINFLETPELARVYGATSGWDFGKILDEVGAGIEARGELEARFDLTGNYDSVQSYIDTMSGPVTVSMVNGAIATSLLDLAGLGLFPWLFSKELQEGYTTIVCVVAPLSFGAGKASSNAVVVETNRVQLVAAGSADWKNDRIAIRAEPRPVGRPLARAPWPFEVTGKLSNPDFRLGGKSRPKPEQQASATSQEPGTRIPCKPDIQQQQ